MQSEEKVKGFLKGGAGDNKMPRDCPHLFQGCLGLFHDVLSSQVRVERLLGHGRWRRWGGNGVDQLRSGAVCAPLRDG